MSVSECKVPYRSGFCVGLGVSSFTGEAAVRPWAFPDFARPQLNTEMDEEGAQPRTIQFEEGFIDRSDHYEKALEFAASLNIKGWGTVSPQGSLEVLCDMQLNSKTQHYVVILRLQRATSLPQAHTNQALVSMLQLNCKARVPNGGQSITGRTTLLGIQWAGTWSVLPASQAKTVSLLVM